MRRFGSDVTIIDRNPRLAHREDDDVTDLLHKICETEGIRVFTNTRIARVEGKSGTAVKLHVTRDNTEINHRKAHDILNVASGRTPNTENIGLDQAGT